MKNSVASLATRMIAIMYPKAIEKPIMIMTMPTVRTTRGR